ncbi:M14 family metallopeptidase [Altibacter sp. HG106]|uniref:M14 family metallopeptidase n=1 Tax=Altibacter sp. HG106 TaxID=3023937 RepID=UPI0023500823|nr:M14 family metallopeptidase [Altibacter sp. HG106]MDC7995834.1 M14 family metallopeptidase [Altibacter sp. HG106]
MRTSTSYLFVIFAALLLSCESKKNTNTYDFTIPFETSEGTETSTYQEVITFYENLADTHTSVAMYKMDNTDSGHPLHLITFNPNRSFESEFSGTDEKALLLINNGIHPGESDGIDASMMLMRNLAEGTIEAPNNTIIAVIPVYNIGGALNRNSTSRTNQNGPEAYGFRGNARNYDLNRDFIKADTRNAHAFARLFHTVNPDVFIDTHVSNGADYQYVLTHLFTQHNKLGGDLGTFLHEKMMPALEDSLTLKSWDITPYVNVFNRTPETGFSQFMDYPRYSTGYTTLFNCLGMMVETHMLKPYKQRVEGTYELLRSMIAITDANASEIKALRAKATEAYAVGNHYPTQWTIDSSNTSTLSFKGYEATTMISEVTGQNRLKYDRNRPFTKEVRYENYYKASDSVTIPEYYVVPKGWWEVIRRLRDNDIAMIPFSKDTTLRATVYRIASYPTAQRPFEGHYMHYNTEVTAQTEVVTVHKGDFRISTQQNGVRYLMETLEPQAPDSFFNWNFFDTILQQKEGFSPYVWEDKATAFLLENPELKQEFENKKAADAEFAQNWYAQLDWIHKKSPNYEASHLRYPIVRVGG